MFYWESYNKRQKNQYFRLYKELVEQQKELKNQLVKFKSMVENNVHHFPKLETDASPQDFFYSTFIRTKSTIDYIKMNMEMDLGDISYLVEKAYSRFCHYSYLVELEEQEAKNK